MFPSGTCRYYTWIALISNSNELGFILVTWDLLQAKSVWLCRTPWINMPGKRRYNSMKSSASHALNSQSLFIAEEKFYKDWGIFCSYGVVSDSKLALLITSNRVKMVINRYKRTVVLTTAYFTNCNAISAKSWNGLKVTACTCHQAQSKLSMNVAAPTENFSCMCGIWCLSSRLLFDDGLFLCSTSCCYTFDAWCSFTTFALIKFWGTTNIWCCFPVNTFVHPYISRSVIWPIGRHGSNRI